MRGYGVHLDLVECGEVVEMAIDSINAYPSASSRMLLVMRKGQYMKLVS